MDINTLGMAKAAGRKSFSPLLAKQTLTADAPAIAFNNIPTGYGELIIVGQVRATNGTTNTTLRMTLNNDVLVSNYLSQRMRATSTTVDSSTFALGASAQIAEITGGTVASATAAGMVEIHLPNYDGTVFDQEFYSDFHYPFGTSGSQYVGRYAGRYQGAPQAIRQITLSAASGNLKAGTTFSVYGRNTGSAITQSDPFTNIAAAGDSQTASATGGGTNLMVHLQSKVENAFVTNKAVASETMTQIAARSADFDLSYLSTVPSICFLLAPTNSLTEFTDPDGAVIYAAYRDYLIARRTTGWKVIATTLPPRSGLSASRQTALDAFNVLVRTNWATFSDELYDVAAVPEFTDPANTTYYVDGLHFTDLARDMIAGDVAEASAAVGGTALV